MNVFNRLMSTANKCSPRQYRLFAVSCAQLVHTNATHQAIEMASQFAEGHCSLDVLTNMHRSARSRSRSRRTIVRDVSNPDDWAAAYDIYYTILSDPSTQYLAPIMDTLAQDILHPQHSVYNAVIQQIAQDIYERQAWSELSILGDALEDNGYTDNELLDHLRNPEQTHNRGCWALESCL